MDFEFFATTLVRLLAGIPLALELAVGSIVIGGLMGLAVALLRLSGIKAFALFAWLYVLVIRSIPLLVLLFLIYYGLGQFAAVRKSILWPFLRDPFWCALLALSVNASAYAAEIIRGALLSVPQNQLEAARACGMSPFLMFRRITLPLAIRQAIPAYSNELIAMVKATSLASLVTLLEISGIATNIAAETYRPVEVYIAAGVIYLAINVILAQAVGLFEAYLSPDRKRPTPVALTPAENGIAQ